MNQSENENIVRQYSYSEEDVIVADLGIPDDEISVDILSDKIIVVSENPNIEFHEEFDIPQGASATAFINNGLVTIKVK
ncbi:MAG: Hsp20/alpha crystallin family protein [Halobacteriaceae archaeon]